MDKIVVLIPCYNEASSIQQVVTDFRATLPDAVIYVYDNNSTDGTEEIARAAGAIVRHEYKQGKGNVIRRMFREVDAQCYLIVDGDGTYPAEAAPEMVDKVLNYQVDMVVGDRLSSTYFQENKRPMHNFGNWLVRLCINKIFHCNIRDIMTGYRAFSPLFVKTFPVLSRGFEIETEMTIHAVDTNQNVCNQVIQYRDRGAGSKSKLNTYSDGVKILFTIFRLFRICKPFEFFSLLAGILFLLAGILFIPVFIDYFKTGLVLRFPTLMVSGFIAIAGIQAFFSGLMLANLKENDRQYFELARHVAHHNLK